LFGHIGLEALVHLIRRRAIDGLHPDLTEAMVRKYFPYQCRICAKGSLSRKPISKNRQDRKNMSVNKIGSSVEIDIMFGTKHGIVPEFGQAHSGYELVLVAVDRSSRFTIAYPLKNATNLEIVLDKLRRRFLADGHILKHLRFDDQLATEAIKEFLLDNKISYDIVPPYEHSLLGLVERTNRTLEEKLIKVMDRVKDKRLWAMAVADSVLKINLSPRAVLGFSNPYESWYRKKSI
jgi:IS30 family transposase